MNRWGDFELLEEIGRGSFGTVYRANHPTLQQQVALKLVPVPSGDPREIEKALEEPRRLASVHHRHVVIVHDARHIDGHVGICMELVRGESLSQVVSRSGRFSAEEASACAATLCRALAAIHRSDIVHNDVKAQNVMREVGGRIVLMDFGAGRRLLDPTGTTGIYLVGTPSYMAPELFELRPPSRSSDIYSLGVLLFYLLTAEYPIEGHSMEQFAAAHAGRRRRYLGDVRDDLPARLMGVVDRALEHDPADRYRTSGEMLSDLLDRNHRTRQPPPRRRDESRSAQHREPRTEGEITTEVVPALPRPGEKAWRGVSTMVMAGVLAGVVALLWLLGFVASQAYNDMFGRFGDFDVDSPFTWLEVGFRALVLPVAVMLMMVTVSLAAAFVWRLSTRLSPSLQTWSSRTSQRVSTATARAGLTDSRLFPTGVLLVQALLLLMVYWTFSDLITAFSTPIALQTAPEHALLARSHESEWIRYCAAASMLALAGGLAWAAVIKRRQPGDAGVAAIVAGIALTGVAVAMFVVPWRIYQNSTFETVLFDSSLCFVVSEKPPRLQLLCPSLPARSPIVDQTDPKLSRPDPSQPQNVFDAAARTDRPQEVP